ncbi:hypothetical protein [Thioclava indica]|uniref:VOC domain-containing protein n=1 Tax=Thioclava indica TaxID=1353528 RepID=A0A074K6U5_9RHOB|nr:hypothetical protein [Thioclava indica]KEO57282.1 hypothetical protein DT23_16985 [Thioclava indica]
MQLRRRDHVNIQVTQVKAKVAWYRDILGLRTGPRPDFPIPGAWLYAEDTAMLHLVAVSEILADMPHDNGKF